MAKSSGGTRRSNPSGGGHYQDLYMTNQDAYDGLVNQTSRNRMRMGRDEKSAIIGYTGVAYSDMNRYLKTDDFLGMMPNSVRNRIDNLTQALEKSSYDTNMTLRRGVQNERSVFGFSVSEASLEQLQQTVGKTYTMKQFGSFSVTDTGGFDGQAEIILRAPKGTKMMYVEPVSSNGIKVKDFNNGANWNGKRQNISGYGEQEMLLQRGTSYKIYKVEKVGRKNVIYATIVHQQKFS